MTLVGGVAPTATRFARYLRKKHKAYPTDPWRIQIVSLDSVPGINTRYRPALLALYGDIAIREFYGATKCMFGQQRDEKKAWVPNIVSRLSPKKRHAALSEDLVVKDH